MSEHEREPSPEEQERERLVKVIREYLSDDEDYLLQEHPDVDDLRMAVDASLLAEGLDPDEILLDSGEYTDVRYAENEGDNGEV